MSVWLASGSPRRRTILEALGYTVLVHPAEIDESRHPGEGPVAYAQRLAVEKAATGPVDHVVLAADTVVHRGDRVFDKPASREQARAHLIALSGVWHAVTTGVCVAHRGVSHALAVTTQVRLRELAPQEIAAYLQTGEADDKAGAYGIQGLGGQLVAELRGSWTNVMGLPSEQVLVALVAHGVSRWGR